MKLSKAQLEILRRLAAGDTLYWMTGLHAYAFWSEDMTGRKPNSNSIFVLRRAGLIGEKPGSRKVSGWKYAMTDAGRAALAQAGGSGAA